MVFTSIIQFVRSRGPDEFWRKRRILKLSAHYRSRPRNCYGLAIRNVHRALVYATKARPQRRADRLDLWKTRIDAGALENNVSLWGFREGLMRQDISLDHKSLADLAAWECRSFSALAAIAERTLRDEVPSEHVKRHDSPVDPVTFDLFFTRKS